MSRAKETAQLILKHLPSDLPVEETPCLAEGAPIPPEPPVGHWRPEYYVSFCDTFIALLHDTEENIQ